MSVTTIDITLGDERWNALGFDAGNLALTAIREAVNHADLPAPLTPERDMDVAVLLTDDEAVRVMNRDFRGKDSPTNVLSFATVDDPDFKGTAALPGLFHLGDLALALETLEREAVQQDKALEAHFVHLIVHGTLHLLGYDHMTDDEADAMEAIEIKILNIMGIENPYLTPFFMQD